MSELNIIRQNIASANVQSQLGAEVQQVVRGERKGQSVSAMSKTSDLSDIQEEIGNAVGKFADKKSLGQAKVRQGAGVNIEALKRIADYYDRLPDMPREAELRDLVVKFQGFEDLLDEGGRSASTDDILEALRSFDRDITHQYEALRVVKRYFETTGAGSDFMAMLEETDRTFGGPDVQKNVQAGYAIAKAASLAAPTLETSPGALRDSYREMLRSEKHIGQLFDQVSNFNIRLNFTQVVDLFLEAAGNELANMNSRADPVILGALIRELGALKEMRTVVEEGDRLIVQTKRIDKEFAADIENEPEITLTSELLNYSSKVTPSMSDARKLVEAFEPASEKTKVVFANGLHDLHRLISDRSVASDAARLQQGAMLRNLRSELAIAEEAAFEAIV